MRVSSSGLLFEEEEGTTALCGCICAFPALKKVSKWDYALPRYFALVVAKIFCRYKLCA